MAGGARFRRLGIVRLWQGEKGEQSSQNGGSRWKITLPRPQRRRDGLPQITPLREERTPEVRCKPPNETPAHGALRKEKPVSDLAEFPAAAFEKDHAGDGHGGFSDDD